MQSTESTGNVWSDYVKNYLKYVCWCCVPPHLRGKHTVPQDVKMDQDQREEIISEEIGEDNGQEKSLVDIFSFRICVFAIVLLV